MAAESQVVSEADAPVSTQLRADVDAMEARLGVEIDQIASKVSSIEQLHGDLSAAVKKLSIGKNIPPLSWNPASLSSTSTHVLPFLEVASKKDQPPPSSGIEQALESMRSSFTEKVAVDLRQVSKPVLHRKLARSIH